MVQLELWQGIETVQVKKARRAYTKRAVEQHEARQLRLIFLPRLLTPEDVAMTLVNHGAFKEFKQARQHVYYQIRMQRIPAVKVGRAWRVIPTWMHYWQAA